MLFTQSSDKFGADVDCDSLQPYTQPIVQFLMALSRLISMTMRCIAIVIVCIRFLSTNQVW